MSRDYLRWCRSRLKTRFQDVAVAASADGLRLPRHWAAIWEAAMHAAYFQKETSSCRLRFQTK